ncbi:MAG: hypothetical protein BA872_00590 [Desulfobacterales bacterium C00003060]|nr:MAG: hypothetical protein BA872_00590 [Desulfobacterales bacterium C00003060]
MLEKKFSHFRREVEKHIRHLRKKKIEESEFDEFVENILSNNTLDVSGKGYCRDGFAFVNEIDHSAFQVACFQINSFGAGVFGDSIVKLCTPILVTIKVHGTHRYLNHSLKNTCISIDNVYIGKSYSGSKGALCDRDNFNSYAKILFLSEPNSYSFKHQIVYQLINANYLCHHIAEVMGYAFGALDVYWTHQKNLLCLSAGCWLNQRKDKLHIDIIEDFSSEKMRGHFEVPHYAKLIEDIERFKEEYDILLWEVTYRNEIETFHLPGGYQKVQKKRFNKNVNVITSQHIIEHVLTAYYKRKNAFVVASTFQTLEYLSRAFIAKTEGRDEEFSNFLENASSCMGYYPERNFKEFCEKTGSKYPAFESEYSHTMFFRPPVLL